MHYQKVGKGPLPSKKLQVSTLLIIRPLQPSYSALAYNDQKTVFAPKTLFTL